MGKARRVTQCEPKNQRGENHLQRVHFGDDGLCPKCVTDGEDGRADDRGDAMRGELPRREIDEHDGKCGAQRREQVQSIRDIVEWDDEREQFAEERVERIPGRMQNAETWDDVLKFQRIVEQKYDGWRECADVQRECEQKQCRADNDIALCIP